VFECVIICLTVNYQTCMFALVCSFEAEYIKHTTHTRGAFCVSGAYCFCTLCTE